jgi:hypothetical protein
MWNSSQLFLICGVDVCFFFFEKQLSMQKNACSDWTPSAGKWEFSTSTFEHVKIVAGFHSSRIIFHRPPNLKFYCPSKIYLEVS